MTRKNIHDELQHSLADRLRLKHGDMFVQENYAYTRSDKKGLAGEADVMVFTPHGMTDYQVPHTYYEVKSNDNEHSRKRAKKQREAFFKTFNYLRDYGISLHFVYYTNGSKIRHWTRLARGDVNADRN